MPRMNLDNIEIDGKAHTNVEIAEMASVTSMAVGKALSKALFSLYKNIRFAFPEFDKEDTLRAIIKYIIEEGTASEKDVYIAFNNKQLQKMICDFEEDFEEILKDIEFQKECNEIGV